ncbi:hypothetical protein ATANTOWER_029484 [Ataeniobius toweri]|uniref:Uncharacterized protein n=1 Tax=Ataeniobius toweri TaxID=208326 RepID=A0ABU7AUK6_9TELE|nr:hypothetical protein [Ataeniobius toweri]
MRVCLPAPAKSRGCSLGLEITRESTKRPLLEGLRTQNSGQRFRSVDGTPQTCSSNTWPVAVRERRVQQRFGIGALT